MLVLFIRHAETVDNVAGVYAGVTDSELTNHGVQQTRYLATWLTENRPAVQKIFASPLQRTRRTANAILKAQKGRPDDDEILVKSPLLIEQDFGSYENTSFYKLPPDPQKTRRAAHAERHKDDPGFKDVESAESMAQRCDQFLDGLLLPTIFTLRSNDRPMVIVVSHGILLSHLWRRFLLRLPKKSITIAPEVTAARSRIVLEHPGGWSNTGILEVKLALPALDTQALPATTPDHGVDTQDRGSMAAALSTQPTSSSDTGSVINADEDSFFQRSIPVEAAVQTATKPPDLSKSHIGLQGSTVTLLTVNGQEHLKGLKRARGGIGSAKYDEGQKSLDSFFKRAKK
ncbi:phosphoglycerate mutase-like protein [Myriangium duriaei CBS 260.36]|uniref:Phosphoglycerate mutase-like protein n=1 Tax=Myriangium duriaei CBS 260.36 TaxID=1168546 RepID=A0A9P4J4A4_9PEZI|nr:phosphoglycerate mutase-like protein [Myriangium duriaei CBS 260.36]